MSDKSPQKNKAKKPAGKTLKEKRAAKKSKKAGGPSPLIPPSGH